MQGPRAVYCLSWADVRVSEGTVGLPASVHTLVLVDIEFSVKGLPKFGVLFGGLPRVRNIAFCVLYWGPLVQGELGNYPMLASILVHHMRGGFTLQWRIKFTWAPTLNPKPSRVRSFQVGSHPHVSLA